MVEVFSLAHLQIVLGEALPDDLDELVLDYDHHPDEYPGYKGREQQLVSESYAVLKRQAAQALQHAAVRVTVHITLTITPQSDIINIIMQKDFREFSETELQDRLFQRGWVTAEVNDIPRFQRSYARVNALLAGVAWNETIAATPSYLQEQAPYLQRGFAIHADATETEVDVEIFGYADDKENLIKDMKELIDMNTDYGTTGGQLPQLYLFYGEKQLDMSGLAGEEQVMAVVDMEMNQIDSMEKILVIAAK